MYVCGEKKVKQLKFTEKSEVSYIVITVNKFNF